MSVVNNTASEKFIEQFTRSQRKLYLFILAQVASASDAEEILQETNLVIWSKCNQFEEGTNFFAWAAAIANFEVLRFRQKRQRDKHTFSQDFVEGIALDMSRQLDHSEERQLALEACLKQRFPATTWNSFANVINREKAGGALPTRSAGQPIRCISLWDASGGSCSNAFASGWPWDKRS
jgi:hypothetical protein